MGMIISPLMFADNLIQVTWRHMTSGYYHVNIWYLIHRFTTRQAKEDFEYQGIKYKAGTCIMSPTLQIQRDERFFPDPMKFDPDRYRALTWSNFVGMMVNITVWSKATMVSSSTARFSFVACERQASLCFYTSRTEPPTNMQSLDNYVFVYL